MITIAIDGYSSCGKSTMAKNLAKELGYIYIDTGAMYRSVTYYAMLNGMIDSDGNIHSERLEQAMGDIDISFRLNPETGRPDTYLNGVCVEDKIRTLEVSRHVSKIAALGFVREAMVAIQREMGKAKGVILDGRDIGTVVFPDAELKIFVKADDRIRAQRRYDELRANGEQCDFDDILRNVRERDYIDTHRDIAPLIQASDAVVLDNSNMSIAEQQEWLLKLTKEAVSASE
ncbi:MAG: (d)CMP kinase [Bacteroidaceae bacterium]|nr:(d)CMP kinase [Bacteroidaceae bacterium]